MEREKENFNNADFAAAFAGKNILEWKVGKLVAKKESTRRIKFLAVELVKVR